MLNSVMYSCMSPSSDSIFDSSYSLSPLSLESDPSFEDDFSLGPSCATEYKVLGAVEEGVGTTYKIQSRDPEDNSLHIFKPTDGEGRSEHGAPLKHGVEYGESTVKEVAAYRLDHGGWAAVPGTHLGTVTMEDGEHCTGSIQQYVSNSGSSEDMARKLFAVSLVQRVGVLDIRLLNLDRHEGNLLVTQECDLDGQIVYGLVPIDHGYILPSYKDLSDICFDAWMYWKQSQEPFTAEVLDYILALDAEGDSEDIRRLGVSEDAIVAQFCATVLLQVAVSLRPPLSLFQVAAMVKRRDCWEDDGPAPLSALEEVMRRLMNEPDGKQEARHFEKREGIRSRLEQELRRECQAAVVMP